MRRRGRGPSPRVVTTIAITPASAMMPLACAAPSATAICRVKARAVLHGSGARPRRARSGSPRSSSMTMKAVPVGVQPKS